MEYKLEFKDGKLRKLKIFSNIIEIYRNQKSIGNSILKSKELAKKMFLEFYNPCSGFKNLYRK